MSKQTDLINIPDAITVDGSNNVGIGTSSPTRQLDVSKAGTAYIRASDTANSVNMEMLAASSGGWLGTQTNHSLNLQTNNTERMRITTSGNLMLDPNSVGNKYARFGTSSTGDGHILLDRGGAHKWQITSGLTNALQFHNYTAGSESMRIDASGRVTTPNQPMFSAYGGAEQAGDVKEVLQFTSATSNVGNHFSTSTYTFTAPVSGHYHFSFSLMTYASDNSRCQFAKNGSLIADQFYAEADGYAEYPRNGASIIVQLSTNDTLRVDRNVQNSASERCHQNYRSFTGYLIG
jgi:hypothetical protein